MGQLSLYPGGGGVLDQILDGDVPSRFQKHTRSLYQFFQNSYPTLYQFFKNVYPTPYQLRNCENWYHSLYQNREIRYPSRWHVPVPKICIVPPPRVSLHQDFLSACILMILNRNCFRILWCQCARYLHHCMVRSFDIWHIFSFPSAV